MRLSWRRFLLHLFPESVVEGKVQVEFVTWCPILQGDRERILSALFIYVPPSVLDAWSMALMLWLPFKCLCIALYLWQYVRADFDWTCGGLMD